MRWGRFIAGLVLAILGLILILAGLAAVAGSTGVPISTGTAYGVKVSALTDVRTTVNWTSASNVTVYMVTSNPTCILPINTVGSGSGTTGSFSANLKPGKTYLVYGCAGTNPTNVRVTVTTAYALSIADVIGAIGLALGALLMVLGIRGRSYRSRNEGFAWLTEPPVAGPSAAVVGVPPAGAQPPSSAPSEESAAFAGPGGAGEGPVGDDRALQGCPNCGKVYPAGQYGTCPTCGASL